MNTHLAAITGDTIVARATAPGAAGIAVVRLSGPAARTIASALAPQSLSQPSHRLVRTMVVDHAKEAIDEGMVVSMHAPHSYTGEDVVELHLHGAEVVVSAVIAAACRAGARRAEPGEFTRRAYALGKVSLAQAEAIGALVHAKGRIEHKAALMELRGGLGAAVTALLDKLERLMAAWYALLDFPEHLPDARIDPNDQKTVAQAEQAVARLIHTARPRLPQLGGVVLAGPSNIGKSTLFNVLAGEERALVDDMPGTTRDRITAQLHLGGQPVMMMDTAGLRITGEGVEARGISQGQQAAQKAAVLLWLVDPDLQAWPEPSVMARTWVIGARADRWPASKRNIFEQAVKARGLHFIGWVSGHTQEGVAPLIDALRVALLEQQDALVASVVEEGLWLAQDRHTEHLEAAQAALAATYTLLVEQAPLDLPLTELREAVWALGALAGRDVDEAVLDQIFANFCIGK